MTILDSQVSRAKSQRYERLYIPRTIVITVWEFLRSNGLIGREQLCFLAGRVVQGAANSESSAQVTTCVLPLTQANAGYVTLTNHAQTSLVLDELEQPPVDAYVLVTLHDGQNIESPAGFDSLVIEIDRSHSVCR